MAAGNLNSGSFEGGAVTSVFIPLTQSDSVAATTIDLIRQEVKVDLSDGYAAVCGTYWFNNPSEKNIELKVGFPATLKGLKFSAKHWLRYHVNDHEPLIAKDTLLGKHWQWWSLTFQPGATEVKLYYGTGTEGGELHSGSSMQLQNCFRYDLLPDHFWNHTAAGNIWIQMNDGYTTADILGVLPAENFKGGSAILHLNVSDLENDSSGQLVIWYPVLDSNRISIGRVSWEQKFNHLAVWNPDEKTLATLSPFHADDFDGQKKDAELAGYHSLIKWSWLAGLLVVLLGVAYFVITELRSRQLHSSRSGGNTLE